ncbi:craniofacial development protein 2-like [Sipha flava]|uniref:Craniofacial development protein 2-like n=1 Tax=Sipha flava TaxID=143950 RepID=A0A8B8FB95_9HEMI|nr:craniofacial development protein 2-like [Sipha flava]
MDRIHQLGVGFAVHKNFVRYVKEFNPISERISTTRLDTNPMNLFIINVHAPTEVKEDIEKDIFYEELAKIFDESLRNTIKVIIGDCNAKIGKETMFIPKIGLQSTHERSNNNGQRLIIFASLRNMTISSTIFPHKDIHKCTWFRSSILNVRSYHGADCDTDHFLVIAKCKIKLKKICTNNNKMMKFDITKLMREEENQKYIHEIEKESETNQRKEARHEYIEYKTTHLKKAFEAERRECKKVVQREKRKYLNELLQSTEQNFTQGKVRHFFAVIKKSKQFNPMLKAIKDKNDRIFIEPQAKISRWREYFEELLNGEMPETNWKAPGQDGKLAEFIKLGGKRLHEAIHTLCKQIWYEEKLPDEWNKAIIIGPYHQHGHF